MLRQTKHHRNPIPLASASRFTKHPMTDQHLPIKIHSSSQNLTELPNSPLDSPPLLPSPSVSFSVVSMGEHSLSPPQTQPQSTAPLPDPTTQTSKPSTSRSKKPSSSKSTNPTATKRPRLTPAPTVPARPLSAEGEVAAGIHYLRSADPALCSIIDSHPDPPSFHCPHRPFHSLVRSILYQQLAFKAAASVYSRFLSLLGGDPEAVVPEAVLSLTPHQLRQIGVSPRKSSYLHDLARKYTTGILSDASIINMDDRSLAAMLTMVKGIGSWSVHMFMIFSLARPDVLPAADLGVRKGVQLLYGLEEVPRPSQMEKLCELWRPYRSVGAWYMWRLIESKAPQPLPGTAVPALQGPEEAEMMMMQKQEQEVVGHMMDPMQMLPGLG